MAEEEGTIMKAPTFDGTEAMWQEWSFVMRAYLAGKLENGQDLLNVAEGTVVDMSSAAIQQAPELAQDNKRMFFMLVMTVKGPAQMILRSQERHNGAACWRALCRRYEPATAMRAQSIMQSILNVAMFPSTLAEFEDKIGEWMRDIYRYEMASGETFNEGVKKSVFLQKAPKNIRTVLQMQSQRSYEELVATTVQYLQAATAYSDGYQKAPSKSDSSAMEVDALTRGKGKGKGKEAKGKGKGKDAKGKSAPGDGCFICGGQHWARDCWWNPNKGKGKDKGKGKNAKGKGKGVNELTAEMWVAPEVQHGSLSSSSMTTVSATSAAPSIRAIMAQLTLQEGRESNSGEPPGTEENFIFDR